MSGRSSRIRRSSNPSDASTLSSSPFRRSSSSRRRRSRRRPVASSPPPSLVASDRALLYVEDFAPSHAESKTEYYDALIRRLTEKRDAETERQRTGTMNPLQPSFPQLHHPHNPPLLLAVGSFQYIDVLYPHLYPTREASLELTRIRCVKREHSVRVVSLNLPEDNPLYSCGPFCAVAGSGTDSAEIAIRAYLTGVGEAELACIGVAGGISSLSSEADVIVAGSSSNGKIPWWSLRDVQIGQRVEPTETLSLTTDLSVSMVLVRKWRDPRELEIFASSELRARCWMSPLMTGRHARTSGGASVGPVRVMTRFRSVYNAPSFQLLEREEGREQVQTGPSDENFAVSRFVPREACFVNSGKLLGHTDVVSSICLDPETESIFTCSKDKTVRRWSRNESRQTSLLQLSLPACRMVSFFELHRLVVGLADGRVNVFDARKLDNRHPLFEWKIHDQDFWTMVRVGPNEIASSSPNKDIRIWECDRRPNSSCKPFVQNGSVFSIAYCGGAQGYLPERFDSRSCLLTQDHRMLAEWHCSDDEVPLTSKQRKRRDRLKIREGTREEEGPNIKRNRPVREKVVFPREHAARDRVEFLAGSASTWANSPENCFRLKCGEVSVPLFRHFLLSSERTTTLLNEPDLEISLRGFSLDPSVPEILIRLLLGQDAALQELDAGEILVDCYVCFRQLGLREEQYLIANEMATFSDDAVRLRILGRFLEVETSQGENPIPASGDSPVLEALLASFGPLFESVIGTEQGDPSHDWFRAFVQEKKLTFRLMNYRGDENPPVEAHFRKIDSFSELELFQSFQQRYYARMVSLHGDRRCTTHRLVPFSGEPHPVHVDVLICRSEYFRHLFHFHGDENVGDLNVPLRSSTLEMYVRYLYTGSFDEEKHSIDDLLNLLAFVGTASNPRMEFMLLNAVKLRPIRTRDRLRKIIQDHVEILNRGRIGGLLRDHWANSKSVSSKDELESEIQIAVKDQLLKRQKYLGHQMQQQQLRSEKRIDELESRVRLLEDVVERSKRGD